MHPHQRHAHGAVEQHEAGGADAGEVFQRTKHNRQQETAQTAGQADNAGHRADVGGVIVGHKFKHRSFAHRHRHADGEHQNGEHGYVEADVQRSSAAVGGLDVQLGLRIREQEETHPTYPHHRPSHFIRTEFVGKIAAECAQHAAGQRETGRQKRCGLQGEAVFADIIFGHPQRQADIAAEHHRIELAVAQHARVFQQRQLLAEGHR